MVLVTLIPAAMAALVLALPIDVWRTGRPEIAPLMLAPAGAHRIADPRIWIDTDAACGASRTTDVDDCFALIALLKTPRLRVAGISTVFGNARLATTDRTTRELVALLEHEGVEAPPVSQGRAGPLEAETATAASPAESSLAAAIETESLVIVALGPLTNIAALLDRRPELSRRIRHVLVIMGQRRGHVFHPVEGGTAGMLLGHGPVFSDFNFANDPEAVRHLLSHDIPLTLVPYDAARLLPITREDIARLARAGAASSWVAERSAGWLNFWIEDIGQRGFFPFDLAAAGFLLSPEWFRCAPVKVTIGRQPWLWRPVLGDRALFVDKPERRAAKSRQQVAYCPSAHSDLREVVLGAIAPKGRAPDRIETPSRTAKAEGLTTNSP